MKYLTKPNNMADRYRIYKAISTTCLSMIRKYLSIIINSLLLWQNT